MCCSNLSPPSQVKPPQTKPSFAALILPWRVWWIFNQTVNVPSKTIPSWHTILKTIRCFSSYAAGFSWISVETWTWQLIGPSINHFFFFFSCKELGWLVFLQPVFWFCQARAGFKKKTKRYYEIWFTSLAGRLHDIPAHYRDAHDCLNMSMICTIIMTV